jgi:hypothetical protein
MAVEMLEPSRRPLRDAEKRLLRARMAALDTAASNLSASVLLPAAALFAVLWSTTLMLSDAPTAVVTAFWIVVGGAITYWVYRERRRDLLHAEPTRRRLQSALRRGEADTYDFRNSGFIEFEEIEDEGACYAFQLADERLAFLCGQEFYPRARFPSRDFCLVYPLAGNGDAVDMVIEKRGPRVDPDRRLSSADRERLEISTSLEVRSGRIDNL